MMTRNEAVVTRRIASDKARLFEAFTKPAILNLWFTSGANSELRIGGAYSNADGDRGLYTTIRQNEQLGFTWDNPSHSPGTHVMIDFAESGEESVVTVRHTGFTDKLNAQNLSESWEWALDNLDRYFRGDVRRSFSSWRRAKTMSPNDVSRGDREK